MTAHAEFDNPTPISLAKVPIVLRFEGLHPRDLGRFDMHDKRKGGDLSHVDQKASHLNEKLFGTHDWQEQLCAEVEDAKRRNLHAHVTALKAKSRKKEARAVLEKGLVDPWKRGRHGPLREGILTVNKSWFGGTGFDEWNPKRVAQFRATALAFLKQHFPDGQLRYACGHADEEAYHIHFVVAVWRDRVSVNRGRQSLLQSSINPLLADYEHAQTVAGQAFKPLGITRGERRAEARRLASAAGEPVPEKRRHTPPSKWRAEQRAQAQAEATEILENAVSTAQAEVENGRSLGKAAIRKSRKRAVREARKRKEDAAREVAAQSRAKDKLAREAEQMRTTAIEAEEKRIEAEQERATAELHLADIVTAETAKVKDLKAAQATETEVLRKLRADRAKAKIVRQKALAVAKAEVTRRDQAESQARRAREDLAEAQAASAEAQSNVAKAKQEHADLARAFKQSLDRRNAEEARLKTLQDEASAAESAKTALEAMIDAAEVGLDLIADGTITYDENYPRGPRLKWGSEAPKDVSERNRLIKRFRPAAALIQRLAKLVARTVQVVLAAERMQLAEDAAFVAGLREDWEDEQQKRLDQLADDTEPSP